MAVTVKTCDVFISHALVDRAIAAEVAAGLGSAGLEVFYGGSIEARASASDVIWEALAESRALVAIVSPEAPTHAMGLVEIGAATAWNKPIFVLLNGPAATKLPAALSSCPVYPASRLEDLIHAIKSSFEPLTDQDRDVLATLYLEMHVAADQLSQSPKAFRQITKQFNRRTHRQFSGERILSEILRMRKQGRLPRLQSGRSTTAKHSSMLERNSVKAPTVEPSALLERARLKLERDRLKSPRIRARKTELE